MKTILCGMMAAVLALSTGTAMAMGSRPQPESSGPKQVVGGLETGISAPDISLADLKQAIDDKTVVLLDCNGSKSYAAGHIPGAIDFEGAKADLAKRMPKDKASLVVAYCGGPKCLAYKAGADAATKLGYTNVKHFSGGISGWKEAGAKLETAANAVKHQTLCPVMGDEINKKIFADYQGKRVYFCCNACPAQFKKDPAKYITKMEAEGITLDKTP